MVKDEKYEGTLLYNVEYINNLNIEIQKLLISLCTAILVFTVSLLGMMPKPNIGTTANFIIFSWICFAASIISGVLALIFQSWWFGHKLMSDRSSNNKYRTKWFGIKTQAWGVCKRIFGQGQIWFFIAGIISATMFAITAYYKL